MSSLEISGAADEIEVVGDAEMTPEPNGHQVDIHDVDIERPVFGEDEVVLGEPD